MFPRAIQQASKPKQVAYSLFLPIALFIWILPLLAVFLTSVRGAKDINTGNVFGWPSEFKFVENYTAVSTQTEAVKYFFNSFLITLPAVGISIALACLAGYALAIYRFRLALPLFFIFVAVNFVPFQILMVPVRDMSVQTGLYNTIAGQFLFHAAFQTGFCTLFMRNFIKALPFDLVESARAAQNPATPISMMPCSVPPATMTSASPKAIIRALSPMAWVPVVQAVELA